MSAALAAVPALLPATANASPQARIAVAAPAARVVSGSIRFGVKRANKSVVRVVFTVDGQVRWTADKRPFRFDGNGVLNTRSLRNGVHTLAVRAYFRHRRTATSRRKIVVNNAPSTVATSGSAPSTSSATPTALGASNALGFVAPPASGVAGPSPALFNRVTYNYSSTLSTSQEASRYQVMVLQASNGPLVAALHAANPHLIILMYQHPWVTRPSDTNTITVCTNYNADLASHPTWFLHSQTGALIQQTGQWPDYLMDPGNPAYQQACAAHAIAMAKQYGFDGVFFDGIVSTLSWELPRGTQVPEYPTLASWQNAMGSWVNYAAAALHGAGLKVFGNLCGTTLTAGLWQKWAAPLDGAMEESWTDGGQGLAQQITDWPKKLADAAWSAANNKYEIMHSYNTTETGNTYGLASMMLAANGTLSYSTSNGNYTTAEANFPEYTTAQQLGAPAGPYVKLTNGVYERAFSGGIVLVNPTSSTIPSFALGGGIYSGSQLSNVRSVTMGPTSGLVLQKVG